MCSARPDSIVRSTQPQSTCFATLTSSPQHGPCPRVDASRRHAAGRRSTDRLGRGSGPSGPVAQQPRRRRAAATSPGGSDVKRRDANPRSKPTQTRPPSCTEAGPSPERSVSNSPGRRLRGRPGARRFAEVRGDGAGRGASSFATVGQAAAVGGAAALLRACNWRAHLSATGIVDELRAPHKGPVHPRRRWPVLFSSARSSSIGWARMPFAHGQGCGYFVGPLREPGPNSTVAGTDCCVVFGRRNWRALL